MKASFLEISDKIRQKSSEKRSKGRSYEESITIRGNDFKISRPFRI